MIEAGDCAPDFSLPNQDGEDVKLSDFASKRLVLCFYPGDFSSVCSDQLSLYESVKEDLAEAGAVAVGVSVDSTYCHAAFAGKGGVTVGRVDRDANGHRPSLSK
ncbi:MAG: redoxin domain-containing protein, partial [bacterium]